MNGLVTVSARSRETRAGAYAAIAFFVMLAGLPTFAGLALVPGPSIPTLTLNICHPLQGLSRVADNVPLARPTVAIACEPLWMGDTYEAYRAAAESRTSDAPDPPPPKPLA